MTARTRNRRATAVFVSLGLHGLLILLFLSSTVGAQLSIGQGAGRGAKRAYVVSLVGLSGGAIQQVHDQANPSPPKADPMKVLFSKLTTDDPNAVPAPQPSKRADAKSLLDDISPSQSEPSKSDARPPAPQAGDSGLGAAKGPTRGTAQGRPEEVKIGGGDGAPARGSLAWAVKDCWQRLPGRSSVPVVLEVVLNDRGFISKPPVIVRPPGAQANEQRLIAEERAIRALASCVPYRGTVALGEQQAFRLDFQPSS